MESQEKFTGKAEIYAKHRPAYPQEYIQYLLKRCDLHPGDCAADIGAGTGMLTRQLLAEGLCVLAVEPNDDMRSAAARALLPHPCLTLVKGSAEETGLPEQCADLVTAAQAFHWFDPARFQQECKRILKPGGLVALVWNLRDLNSPVHQANREICRELCPSFKGFNGGMNMEEAQQRFQTFFRGDQYEQQTFSYPLTADLKRFLGRNLSSSYAPRPSDDHYKEFIEALTGLFHRYSDGKQIVLPHITYSYIGEV